MVTLKKIETQNLPEVNEALAQALGIADGTVEALRADIKRNLEREVKFRVLARNKASVMDAVAKSAELDLPTALVKNETDRMVESARADLKKRGVKDADKAPIPEEIFTPQAERRVRLGLVVAELVRANNLAAKPDQLQAHIEEMAQSYEKPAEVVRWYLSDRQRMAEVEGVVIENNHGLRSLESQGHRQGAPFRRADGRLKTTSASVVKGRQAARPRALRACSAGFCPAALDAT